MTRLARSRRPTVPLEFDTSPSCARPTRDLKRPAAVVVEAVAVPRTRSCNVTQVICSCSHTERISQ